MQRAIIFLLFSSAACRRGCRFSVWACRDIRGSRGGSSDYWALAAPRCPLRRVPMRFFPSSAARPAVPRALLRLRTVLGLLFCRGADGGLFRRVRPRPSARPDFNLYLRLARVSSLGWRGFLLMAASSAVPAPRRLARFSSLLTPRLLGNEQHRHRPGILFLGLFLRFWDIVEHRHRLLPRPLGRPPGTAHSSSGL